MRTVSFSSPTVRALLNQRFIPSVANCEGEASAGSSMGHAPSDPPGPCPRGIGAANVQLYFLTPKGAIFHAISGFVAAEELERELRFALALFKAIRRQSPKRARALVREAHKKRLEADRERSGEAVPFGENGNFAPEAIFQDLTRKRRAADDQLMIDRPLLSWSDFRPEMLTGSGGSSFVSNGGKISGGKIGGRDP